MRHREIDEEVDTKKGAGNGIRMKRKLNSLYKTFKLSSGDPLKKSSYEQNKVAYIFKFLMMESGIVHPIMLGSF